MANLTNSSNIIDEINSKLTNPEGGSNGQVLTMAGGIVARGPAPEGFHIPTTDEWQAVYDMGVALGQWSSSNGNGMRIKLKLPFAGYRNRSSTAYVLGQGSSGLYWSSTAFSADNAYHFNFNSSSLNPKAWGNRANGHSVRPFKNTPLIPTSSWTVIYTGSNGAGIFHNASEGVISISSDGQTWITIADKNLGATTVYNDGDSLSESNYGYFYQWGNNYGFPGSGKISKTSSNQVDASAYGKLNPYSFDTFITTSPWDSSDNRNLWGVEDLGELKPQWKDIEALPEGGTAGQVLKKTANGTEWGDETKELPEGGTDGQILTMKNSGGRYPQPQWTTPDFGDVKYNDFKFYTADAQDMASGVLLRTSTFIDTPTANFVINAPIHMEDTMYHEGLVYTLRVKNGNTAYTMTLGEGITNPGDTDVTLTPNAIDQFVFLAVDGVLELQPEASGGGGGESPNTVKLFTMPSEGDNISGIVEHLTNGGQIVLQDEFDIYQSTFFEEGTITVSLVGVNSITNININYDGSNVVESITVIDSNFGPSPVVVEEVPAEEVAGKLYLINDK